VRRSLTAVTIPSHGGRFLPLTSHLYPPRCQTYGTRSLGAVSQAPEAHGALLAVAFTIALHPSVVEAELGQQSLKLLLDATKEGDERIAVAACEVRGGPASQ
jgi:hypothetical protein